jgi:hypothetical protein
MQEPEYTDAGVAADKDLTIGDGWSRELDSHAEFISSVGGLVAVVKRLHPDATSECASESASAGTCAQPSGAQEVDGS